MKPMLAKTYEKRYARVAGFVQPKLDGVRLIWTGSEALSRSGKPILGLPALTRSLHENYRGFPLDGELYVHGQSFQSFLGDIRQNTDKLGVQENTNVGYHIYDLPIAGMPFEKRHAMLVSSVQPSARLQVVPTAWVDTRKGHSGEFLERNLNVAFTSLGYEGTMWRNPLGMYEYGKRSSDLLKIKAFKEQEYIVVGVSEKLSYDKIPVPEGTPGSKRYADGSSYKDENPMLMGTLGALICAIGNDTFQVGTGFDDLTRDAMWRNPPIGKTVTVKFFEFTDDGKPRFPVFKAIRDYE